MRAILALLAMITQASAHDLWKNGDPVPPWVKSSCCGAIDLHNYDPKDVKMVKGGYIFPGWPFVVPFERVQPSPDDTAWIFHSETNLYCVFMPYGGT